MNRPFWRILFVATALISAAGCAGLPQARRGSAAYEAPASGESAFPRAAPEAPQTAPEVPPPGQNPAVVALLGSAAQKSGTGRLDEAAAELERALRIEPRDAEIWVRLAEVRLHQGQFRQAETLGLKAAGLTSSREGGLRARCYRVVARARRFQGDAAGAEQAEEKARAAVP